MISHVILICSFLIKWVEHLLILLLVIQASASVKQPFKRLSHFSVVLLYINFFFVFLCVCFYFGYQSFVNYIVTIHFQFVVCLFTVGFFKWTEILKFNVIYQFSNFTVSTFCSFLRTSSLLQVYKDCPLYIVFQTFYDFTFYIKSCSPFKIIFVYGVR